MAQKLTGMLKLSRIPKELIYTNQNGEKSIWVDIFEKNQPDQYGNTHYIKVYDKANRKNYYIADLKMVEFGMGVDSAPAQEPAPAPAPARTPLYQQAQQMQEQVEQNDLPF